MIARALAGLLAAAAIALAARLARSLAPSGAVAAVGVGTAAVTAGWRWGALLIAFFASGTALSRWRAREKARRTDAVVAKGGERDAAQVLANGGVFALCALGAALAADAASPLGALRPAAIGASAWAAAWSGAAAGAIAAAAADTWATEIGTLARGAPRSVRGWRPVPPGTSGAVSAPGTLALVAGATAMALVAWALGLERSAALGAFSGGVAGAVADTLAGATVQERRRCPRCDAATERTVHDCGTATTVVAGRAGFGNDAVNVLCGVVGALVGGVVGAMAGGEAGALT